MDSWEPTLPARSNLPAGTEFSEQFAAVNNPLLHQAQLRFSRRILPINPPSTRLLQQQNLGKSFISLRKRSSPILLRVPPIRFKQTFLEPSTSLRPSV